MNTRKSKKIHKMPTFPSFVCRHVDAPGELGQKMRRRALQVVSPKKQACAVIMQISYLSSEKTKKNIFLGFGKYFCFLKRKFCVCNNTKTRKHWRKLIIFIRFCKHCLLSPVQTGTFFLESLTSFPCSCARQKLSIFPCQGTLLQS